MRKDHQDRFDRLLEEASCQALLVVSRSSRDPWLASFVGPVKLGSSFVLAARGSAPRLAYWTPMERDEAAATGLTLLTPQQLDIVRWAREADSPAELLAHLVSRALQLCEVQPGSLALAGHWGVGQVLEACSHLAREGWSFAPGESIVSALRKTKSEVELLEMRRVAEGAMGAFRRVAELLAAAQVIDGELWLEGERLRVRRLTREVARALADFQLEQPMGGICAPAREGAVPHSSGTPDRVLRPHESLVLDLYPKGALFVDCTRTFCVGEPPEALRVAHAQVLEALKLAREQVRPGARGWSLQQLVCEHFSRAGYPTPIADRATEHGYVHGLGHGVGFEIHEHPFFSEESQGPEGVLEEGDVLTLEPGLYQPDEGWAVRLEDLYYLGPEGLESLLPLPYAMDPRVW